MSIHNVLHRKIEVSFSCICRIIENEFCHNIIKVAVDPWGNGYVDPQLLWQCYNQIHDRLQNPWKTDTNLLINRWLRKWLRTNNILLIRNRPFPSSLVPLFQTESKCETFHMKMSSARSFLFMQIKVIFIRMVSHLDSLWNGGKRELGNGLLWLRSLSGEN